MVSVVNRVFSQRCYRPKIVRFFRFICVGLIALFSVTGAMATSYYVDTAAQFNLCTDKSRASFSTLRAGDRVYLKGGSWDGLVSTLTGSMTDAEAQTNPAIILACDGNYSPTVGGVTAKIPIEPRQRKRESIWIFFRRQSWLKRVLTSLTTLAL